MNNKVLLNPSRDLWFILCENNWLHLGKINCFNNVTNCNSNEMLSLLYHHWACARKQSLSSDLISLYLQHRLRPAASQRNILSSNLVIPGRGYNSLIQVTKRQDISEWIVNIFHVYYEHKWQVAECHISRALQRSGARTDENIHLWMQTKSSVLSFYNDPQHFFSSGGFALALSSGKVQTTAINNLLHF